MSVEAFSELGAPWQALAIVGGFAGLFYLYAVAVFVRHSWALKAYPGPLALPIVGNLFNTLILKSFITYVRVQRKRYGKMFVMWPGMTPFLVAADPLNVRQILSDTKRFIKGPAYTEKFSQVFGEGLVTSPTAKHKKDRKCLGKYFIRSNLERHLSVIAEYTRESLDGQVEPLVGKPEANIENMFHLLTLRVFGRVALSVDFWENMDNAHYMNKAVSEGSNIIGTSIVLGMPVWPQIFSQHRKLMEYCSNSRAIISETLINRRRDGLARGDPVPDDCLTAMLRDGMSDKDVLDQIVSLVAAGHDTTSFFCCYMSYLLSKHRGAQDRVKEEIRRVVGDRAVLTPQDLDELVYLKQVMLETLRLFSVIPFVMREATETVTMKETGDVIPRGTQVLVPIGHMNRDEEVWDKPNEFIPERFQGISGSSAKHGFLPFGYGSRACIGNSLAMMEATVIMVNILQRYRLEEVPGFKPKIIAGISLVTSGGMLVKIKREQL